MIVAMIVVSLLAITFFTYILLISANMDKTDREREIEDNEQLEYIRNYKNGGNKGGNKKRNKTNL
ncbi:MAG: hypothetical protein HFJ54_01315 [Clostridia bacterium]|nr:hypothetical protein [Clostridia bacterium]